MSADTAPAAMPTDEEIEAEILPMTYDGADLTECVARVRALFAKILAEKERLERVLDLTRESRLRWFASALHERKSREAAEAALAGERERVCDITMAMCEKWIAAFAGHEINHTPAHEYAEGAVRDIMDQIAAIRAGE